MSAEVLTLVALCLCTSANALSLVQTGDGRVVATIPLGVPGAMTGKCAVGRTLQGTW